MVENKINKVQLLVACGIVVLIGLFGIFINNSKLVVFLTTGMALGYILTRARFGFAGGIKRIYITGEGSLTKALLIMFAVAMIATAGVHWGAAANGALPAFRAGSAASIPGTSSVHALDLGVLLGGFLFGIGMMIAGGCASGTLTDFGEGAGRAFISLCFFILGSIPGLQVQYMLHQTTIGKMGATVYLPDVMGYLGTLIVSIIILLVLYIVTRKYENFRKKEGYYSKTIYEDDELPLAEDKGYKFFSYKTYHKFFIERWSFMAGGLLLAVMFVYIINTSGHSWGVTGPFTNWGVAFFQMFGVQFSSPAFKSVVATVNNGLINDAFGLRNIGIILGALIAMLLAGKFKFDLNFKLRDVWFYILGGFLMGFGARLAGGCNIGALFSGICNFSLSGWGFFITLTLGGILGLKVFEGKVDVIPPNRHKDSPVEG